MSEKDEPVKKAKWLLSERADDLGKTEPPGLAARLEKLQKELRKKLGKKSS